MRPSNETATVGVILQKNVGRYGDAHLTHLDMFQGTFAAAAGSPVLSTQALLARVLKMAYYEQLVKLGITAAAMASFSTTVFIHVRWTGFIVAAAPVAFHALVVAIATVLTQLYTTTSLLGKHSSCFPGRLRRYTSNLTSSRQHAR